jgi:hypothetical protein
VAKTKTTTTKTTTTTTTYVIYIFLHISWSYLLLNLRCMQGRGLSTVRCCAVGYWTPYVAWYGASYDTRLAYVTKNRHRAFVHFHSRVGFSVLSQAYMNTNPCSIQYVCISWEVFSENVFTSNFSSEKTMMNSADFFRNASNFPPKNTVLDSKVYHLSF